MTRIFHWFFMWKMDPMSGFDICLVFALPTRDSTLQYKRCLHFWNNFPCITSLEVIMIGVLSETSHKHLIRYPWIYVGDPNFILCTLLLLNNWDLYYNFYVLCDCNFFCFREKICAVFPVLLVPLHFVYCCSLAMWFKARNLIF